MGSYRILLIKLYRLFTAWDQYSEFNVQRSGIRLGLLSIFPLQRHGVSRGRFGPRFLPQATLVD